jgi:hypothetical protein
MSLPRPRSITGAALLACVLAATTTAGDGLPVERAPLAVGQPIGNLHLPRLDGGEPIGLDSFAGRKVLLIEFASW